MKTTVHLIWDKMLGACRGIHHFICNNSLQHIFFANIHPLVPCGYHWRWPKTTNQTLSMTQITTVLYNYIQYLCHHLSWVISIKVEGEWLSSLILPAIGGKLFYIKYALLLKWNGRLSFNDKSLILIISHFPIYLVPNFSSHDTAVVGCRVCGVAL